MLENFTERLNKINFAKDVHHKEASKYRYIGEQDCVFEDNEDFEYFMDKVSEFAKSHPKSNIYYDEKTEQLIVESDNVKTIEDAYVKCMCNNDRETYRMSDWDYYDRQTKNYVQLDTSVKKSDISDYKYEGSSDYVDISKTTLQRKAQAFEKNNDASIRVTNDEVIVKANDPEIIKKAYIKLLCGNDLETFKMSDWGYEKVGTKKTIWF